MGSVWVTLLVKLHISKPPNKQGIHLCFKINRYLQCLLSWSINFHVIWAHLLIIINFCGVWKEKLHQLYGMMRWIAFYLFIIMINCSIYRKMAAFYSFLVLDHVSCLFLSLFKCKYSANPVWKHKLSNFKCFDEKQGKICLCLNCLIWGLWKMPVFPREVDFTGKHKYWK